MSIITRYIIKEHIGPFLFGLSTIVFVFLLNIAFRDLGKLLGKGIPAGVILEFFMLNLAWILALAIPMAVLIGTLMAFGRLSADNEISALKANGVNLYHLIFPVVIASCVLCVLMERFNNCVLPDFNHRVRLLYSDISRKRPTLTLEPHVFFDDIRDFSMFVHGIEDNGNILKEIIIYDTSDPELNKTIFAEWGQIRIEGERMVLTLFNGEIHEIEVKNLENYKRLKFDRQVLSEDVPNLILKRSESEHRGDREKSANMMKADIGRIRTTLEQRYDRVRDIVKKDMAKVFPEHLWNTQADSLEEKIKVSGLTGNVSGRSTGTGVRRIHQQLESEVKVIHGYMKSIDRKRVEIHKKYSIPVACIVFVLIGAPLGIMGRHGGMATGGGMSLTFFLIYWAFLIGGEQLADRRIMSPIVAMWSPNILVGSMGVYLVIRTVKEMTFIPWEQLSAVFKKYFAERK